MAALLPGEPVEPAPIHFEEIRGATRDGQLVREPDAERFYEYYPVTEHIVSAPRVCGGRLTVKGTRISPGVLLGYLDRGKSPEQLARDYGIPLAAVREVQELGGQNDRDIFERRVLVSAPTA
jgi:uncharacterized protein (DUF433 family)